MHKARNTASAVLQSYSQLQVLANNDVLLPINTSYWIGSSTDTGTRLRMHSKKDGYADASYIDYYPDLNFRVGNGGMNLALSMDPNGNILYYASFKYSDARLKENIKLLNKTPNRVDSIYHLNAVTYNQKIRRDSALITTFSSDLKKETIGFLAQDVQKIYPELVHQDEKGYLSLDYTGLIPVITEALKSQKAMIDAQNLKIKELENRLNKIESK